MQVQQQWSLAKELVNVTFGMAGLFIVWMAAGGYLFYKHFKRKLEEMQPFKAKFEKAKETLEDIGLKADGEHIYIRHGGVMQRIGSDTLNRGLVKVSKALDLEMKVYTPPTSNGGQDGSP